MLIHDDVRTLTARLVRDQLGCLPSVIVGSPPCQDASLANTKGRGVDGERTGLFFEAVRLVDEIRPVWGCFENVPGIRTRGADRVCAALEKIGYTVRPLVVGAWHAGAPHRRNRVWFVFTADAAQERWRERRPGRPDSGHAGEQQPPLQGAHAANADDLDGDRRRLHPGGRELEEPPIVSGGQGDIRQAPADADQARQSGGQLEPGIRAAQEPDYRCPFEQAWPDWNPRAADAGRVDDGLPAGVDRAGFDTAGTLATFPPSAQRAAIAAYGDAVVPQITEAIGRAMMQLCPTDGTVLDLFTGAAGGWSFGMERAGYRTVAVCEFDPWRRSILAERYAA